MPQIRVSKKYQRNCTAIVVEVEEPNSEDGWVDVFRATEGGCLRKDGGGEYLFVELCNMFDRITLAPKNSGCRQYTI